ncbi:chloride channel protein [Oscillatoriales cyanobacterium LEGE 11467]|uniref:Chloride channel protein n=1 Tax=Zarconia navalis LEGE 11467 TaxID=1828826 RepID=A0A928VX45_9CYAN|nr:chloride channel protein [Zarconia navalis]MBE9040893.1 chloride channel protein [Zarconia navalis LEGE 11467]
MSYFRPPWLSRRFIESLLSPKRFAFLEACAIGLISALAAVLLKQGVGSLGAWRVHQSQAHPAILALPAIGLVGGYGAGILVEYLAPEASGTGLAQVKAMLAGVPMTMNLRVAAVKMVSTILTVGSGLTLGRQGPTLQIGASLAEALSRWIPTSPDYRCQMIAAGAAAGLAAGFNAPITGVLFVVEELLHDVSSFTLGSAILASFVGAVVSRLLGGGDWDLNLELVASRANFSALDIPFLLLLGAIAGLFSGLFSRSIVAGLNFNRRFIKLSLPLRMGLAGLVSGAAIALFPVAFRDNTGLREFLSTGEANIGIVAIAFVAKFALTTIAYGSGAPGGLFAPALVLGSALGCLVGLCSQALFGIGEPTTYALAGMGAFFSGVAKVPITAIAIVFEITTDFNLVLPLMITSVTAFIVSGKVARGSLYDALLVAKGIDLKQDYSSNATLTKLTADDVMQRQVETLESHLTLDRVRQAFSRSHHRGFPVVENGQLVGTVSQSDLPDITQHQVPEDCPLQDIMTPQPVTVHPTDTLSDVLYQLNRYKISRLPVTEGRRLVGIITRSDIIRVEANVLGGRGEGRVRGAPSYVVYQTRAPEIGRGRLLVPLANPRTAPMLLQLAATIARDRHSEIECLNIVSIARHKTPSETPVSTTLGRRLLGQGRRVGKQWNLCVHTQIRAACDVSEATLETIRERHIDLLLMGWKGRNFKPDRIFGDAVDTLIRQASCDIILVKWGRTASVEPNPTAKLPQFDRWLIPIGGGPNVREALRLLPSLIALGKTPSIHLCQVFDPNESNPDRTALREAKAFLFDRLGCPITTASVLGFSVADTILDIARTRRSDVVLLGASRKSLLSRVVRGNIARDIIHGCKCTAIVVRSADP